MRKKTLRIFGLVALSMVALAGCATVSNVTNNNSELIFNGGTVAEVGDYLYYSNAYTPLDGATTSFAYSTNAKLSYLGRVNIEAGFGLKAEKPKETAKVNSKVTGHENSYIFILGDYVYFTAPSQHKNDELQQTYNLVSLFRSKLNGDSLTELYTTDQYNNSTAQMRVLKDSDNSYYWIVYDGTDLNYIKLGTKLGKRQTIKNVDSVAMPNENDNYQVKRVYYTVTNDSKKEVLSLDYATGVSKPATSNNDDVSFIDREGDVVFFTSQSKTYSQDLRNNDATFSPNEAFYDSANIKAIYSVYDGFAFTVGSSNLKVFYKSSETSPTRILDTDEFSQILYVNGDWIYYSKDSEIKRISVRNVLAQQDMDAQTVVTMKSNIVGKASSDGEYLYYYAGLEPADEEDEKTYEESSNNYLYRVKLGPNQNYQILSNFTRTEIDE